ncbi:hypothetical protein COLSTE_01958 [Collinsella stercoris DSM 13279]|uniref:Uncharacterized protein n=1 Tax=Collinsella stercoris DSM 13279 TaxID=445975 RepID=B6GCY0_9ACTN|nr:hypothetical protein COLSTE_01958 [Collinsella stercoris DSM 13279]
MRALPDEVLHGARSALPFALRRTVFVNTCGNAVYFTICAGRV